MRPTSRSVSMKPSFQLAKVVLTITCVCKFSYQYFFFHSLNSRQTIAGVATALLQVAHPSFRAYAKQVIANARTLASALIEYGYKLQTGGTDNHLVLWDLRPIGLTGSKVEKICDLMGITINSLYFSPCIHHIYR
jgi:glycine/serine hydroxymethyltransferase